MQEKKKIEIFEKEKIIKYFYYKNFGETITFEELQQFTHYNLKDEYESYMFKANLMRKVKNELIKNGYVLKSIRKIGYYILKPNQIQSYTYRTYIKRPLRQYEKAKIILDNTKKNNLNSKELKKHNLTEQLDEELINSTNNILNAEIYKELKIQS